MLIYTFVYNNLLLKNKECEVTHLIYSTIELYIIFFLVYDK